MIKTHMNFNAKWWFNIFFLTQLTRLGRQWQSRESVCPLLDLGPWLRRGNRVCYLWQLLALSHSTTYDKGQPFLVIGLWMSLFVLGHITDIESSNQQSFRVLMNRVPKRTRGHYLALWISLVFGIDITKAVTS